MLVQQNLISSIMRAHHASAGRAVIGEDFYLIKPVRCGHREVIGDAARVAIFACLLNELSVQGIAYVVMDGHGGTSVVKYATEHCIPTLEKALAKAHVEVPEHDGGPDGESTAVFGLMMFVHNVTESLHRCEGLC